MAKIDDVFKCIRGEEKCSWSQVKTATFTDNHQKNQTRQYTENYNGRTKIIDQRSTIWVFHNKQLLSGQYQFPFSIFIPYEWPPSTLFTGSNSIYGSIKYSIKAVLKASKLDK